MTGSPKIQDFKSCVPRASWFSCSGPQEALGTRMLDLKKRKDAVLQNQQQISKIQEKGVESTLHVVTKKKNTLKIGGSRVIYNHLENIRRFC